MVAIVKVISLVIEIFVCGENEAGKSSPQKTKVSTLPFKTLLSLISAFFKKKKKLYQGIQPAVSAQLVVWSQEPRLLHSEI